MNIRTMTATLALLLAAGCFPDVSEGKSKATVNEPASTAPVAAPEKEEPSAEARTLQVDATRSKVAAVGAKVTRKHDITFNKWSGTLTVAGAQLTGVDIEIDMSSLQSDEEKLTGHLKSPDFFDVAKFPKATFKATKIEPNTADGATHVITGNMTMHGITKQLSFPATVSMKGGAVEASAGFVIDRKDFDITYPGMPDDLIKDDVALQIDLVSGKSDA